MNTICKVRDSGKLCVACNDVPVETRKQFVQQFRTTQTLHANVCFNFSSTYCYGILNTILSEILHLMLAEIQWTNQRLNNASLCNSKQFWTWLIAVMTKVDGRFIMVVSHYWLRNKINFVCHRSLLQQKLLVWFAEENVSLSGCWHTERSQ